MNAEQLEYYTRGIYRLLTQMGDCPARQQAIRELQRRFVSALPVFVDVPASVEKARTQADILDALEHYSLEAAGQSFDHLCQPYSELSWEGTDDIQSVEDEGAFDDARAWLESHAASRTLSAFEAFYRWLSELVLEGLIYTPDVCHAIERRALQILSGLNPVGRAAVVIFLYDAGLIFNLYPRISLAGAYLSRADLEGALLARAQLENANLRGAQLARADLAHATLRQANLITANLNEAHLAFADMADTEMAGAALEAAWLTRANLAQANLVRATLRAAHLQGANLVGANLLGAHLENADLTGADLRRVNLLWCDLSGATLAEVQLHDALYNVHTQWPATYAPPTDELILIE